MPEILSPAHSCVPVSIDGKGNGTAPEFTVSDFGTAAIGFIGAFNHLDFCERASSPSFISRGLQPWRAQS
jgi:hypothetical protein